MTTDNMHRLYYLNDEPISTKKNDLLYVDQHVDGFSKYIRICETPLTISIQGKWGSGKTSFFRLVQEKIEREQEPKRENLEENPDEKIIIQGDSDSQSEAESESWDKCCFLTFNAWQFSQFNTESDLPVALIASLTDQLEKMMDHSNDNDQPNDMANKVGISEKPKNTDEKKVFFKKLRKAVSAALTIGNIIVEKKVGVNLKKEYDQANSQYKEIDKEVDSFFENIEILSELKSEFSLSISDALQKKFGKISPDGKNSSRMIIFVDDLDRLAPEKAVDLLDTIKLFLDCPRCVFILAVDYEVVIKGVELKYKDALGGKKKQEYFEKMIQVVYKLPNSMLSLKGYLSFVANDFGFNKSNSDDLVMFAKAAGKDNPRGIKRLLNNYKLITTIGEKDIKRLEEYDTNKKLARCLFGLLCISENEPDLFGLINDSYNKDLDSALYKIYKQEFDDNNICSKKFINWFIGEEENIILSEKDFLDKLYDNNREIIIYALQIMNYSYDFNSDIAISKISFRLTEADKNQIEYEYADTIVKDSIDYSLKDGTKEDAYVSTIKWLLDHCKEEDKVRQQKDEMEALINKFPELLSFESDEKKKQSEILVGKQKRKLFINLFNNIDEYIKNLQKFAKAINIYVTWVGYGDGEPLSKAEERKEPSAHKYLDFGKYLSDFAVTEYADEEPDLDDMEIPLDEFDLDDED